MQQLKLHISIASIFIWMMIIPFNSYSQDKSKFLKEYNREDILHTIEIAKNNISKDPQKAFEQIEAALISSIKSKNKLGEALSYRVLGMINLELSQYDLSIEYYKKALDILESTGNKPELNNTYWLLAEACQKNNEPQKSIDYYNLYLKYVQKTKNIEEEIECKKRIAEIYYSIGNDDEALKLHNEVLKEEEKRDNVQGVIETQNRIGEIYLEDNQNDVALQSYENSVKLARGINDQKALANTLQKQSIALRKNRDYNQELNVRQELNSMNELDNDTSIQIENYLEIGNIYIEQNKEEQAIPYIQKSIEYSNQTGNLDAQSLALRQLSTAYGKQKDFNKALEVYMKYAETVDAIHQRKEKEILSSLQLATNLNRKLQRLDMLEKDLELSEKAFDIIRYEQQVSQKELKAQRILNYSLISALIILTMASFFIYRMIGQKRKANQLLALKSLRSQMNPHFIYNSLNSVNSYISRNDERSANKYLSGFSKLMRSIMENSKHDFVPLSSEIEILKIYLNLEHLRFGDKFDYKLDVASDLDADNYAIPPMLIQPYIENAIWHGLRYLEEKGFLNVNISKQDNFIKVVIEDNGIGRKKSKELKTKHQKDHVSTGLKNIQNRLSVINELYKTKMDIQIEDMDKEHETGTKVTIKIPHNNLYS